MKFIVAAVHGLRQRVIRHRDGDVVHTVQLVPQNKCDAIAVFERDQVK